MVDCLTKASKALSSIPRAGIKKKPIYYVQKKREMLLILDNTF